MSPGSYGKAPSGGKCKSDLTDEEFGFIVFGLLIFLTPAIMFKFLWIILALIILFIMMMMMSLGD